MSRDPLELLLRPAWPRSARVVCRAEASAPRVWLRNGDWRIYAQSATDCEPAGDVIATFERDVGPPLAAFQVEGGDVTVPFSLRDAYDSYVSERWRDASANPRLSERTLGLFYRVRAAVPRRLQLAARRRLIARQGVPEFPRWPLDVSVGRLLQLYAVCSLRAAGRDEGEFLWFWPESRHAAVILTHDVEGDEGIREALALADLEEEHGFRSSFNFGAWYDRPDPGVLRELTTRGFEVGMHGLTHDRRLFASREAFEARLEPLAELAARLGAVGFRSPATHRVFPWLAELPVEYDCTIPNSDPYEPVPGGCCSVWPFFIGDVVELPYTLPQDHTLLTLLGHRSPELWLEQAAAIEREHGLVQCVSHPDPGYLADADKRAVYRDLLQGLAERPRLWRALPREVAAWWRRRAAAADEELPRGTVRLEDGTCAVFAPPS